MKQLLQKMLGGLALGVVIYAMAAIYVGVEAITSSLARFQGWVMVPVVGLSLVNYLLRYFKWSLYLRVLGVDVPRGQNITIFLSGLAMVVTPGKIGELLKSYLLKTARGVPMAKTAPVILAERLTDLIALLALMSLGLAAFRIGLLSAAIGGAIVVGFIVVIGTPSLARPLVGLLGRMPLVRRYRDQLDVFYQATVTLFRPRPLMLAVALSLTSWFCECFGTYLVVSGFPSGSRVSLFLATFIYSATTVGGLPTPGGLGLTEGGMAAMLSVQGGLARGAAAAATLLVRLATLWLAVLVGAFALLLFRRQVGISAAAVDELGTAS